MSIPSAAARASRARGMSGGKPRFGMGGQMLGQPEIGQPQQSPENEQEGPEKDNDPSPALKKTIKLGSLTRRIDDSRGDMDGGSDLGKMFFDSVSNVGKQMLKKKDVKKDRSEMDV